MDDQELMLCKECNQMTNHKVWRDYCYCLKCEKIKKEGDLKLQQDHVRGVVRDL